MCLSGRPLTGRVQPSRCWPLWPSGATRTGQSAGRTRGRASAGHAVRQRPRNPADSGDKVARKQDYVTVAARAAAAVPSPPLRSCEAKLTSRSAASGRSREWPLRCSFAARWLATLAAQAQACWPSGPLRCTPPALKWDGDHRAPANPRGHKEPWSSVPSPVIRALRVFDFHPLRNNRKGMSVVKISLFVAKNAR